MEESFEKTLEYTKEMPRYINNEKDFYKVLEICACANLTIECIKEKSPCCNFR